MSKIKRRERRKKEFPFTSRKQYADWLWYLLIKARADFKSEKNGEDYTEAVLNSHHLVGNGGMNFNLRYNLLNGICITQGEHNYQAHGNQLAQKRFEQYVKELRGNDIFDKLMVYDQITENLPLAEIIEQLEKNLCDYNLMVKAFYEHKYTQNSAQKPKYLYLFKRFEELK